MTSGTIGERLKAAREARDLTLDEAAALLSMRRLDARSGEPVWFLDLLRVEMMPDDTYGVLLEERARIRILEDLAEIYGVEVEWLMGMVTR